MFPCKQDDVVVGPPCVARIGLRGARSGGGEDRLLLALARRGDVAPKDGDPQPVDSDRPEQPQVLVEPGGGGPENLRVVLEDRLLDPAGHCRCGGDQHRHHRGEGCRNHAAEIPDQIRAQLEFPPPGRGRHARARLPETVA
ncbi:MAG: hypothetical protein LC808_15635 [Actinobacteria bacterium]|nr:hypothetical protein [Actinomycetota bacterium]